MLISFWSTISPGINCSLHQDGLYQCGVYKIVPLLMYKSWIRTSPFLSTSHWTVSGFTSTHCLIFCVWDLISRYLHATSYGISSVLILKVHLSAYFSHLYKFMYQIRSKQLSFGLLKESSWHPYQWTNSITSSKCFNWTDNINVFFLLYNGYLMSIY